MFASPLTKYSSSTYPMAARFSGMRVWAAAPNGYDVAVTLIGPVIRVSVIGPAAAARALVSRLGAGTPAPATWTEFGSVSGMDCAGDDVLVGRSDSGCALADRIGSDV